MDATNPAVCAIYCRISQDASGEAQGVARQEEDCRALAEAHGLAVVEVYVDNDVSASSYSRKKRKAYARMLDDARAGRFGVIVAYSNSRITRRLAELEELIQLHEQHGIRILTVVSGTDNLATADGRMVARIKASVDIAESDRISERVTRKHLEAVQAGRVVGGGNRPFGYEEDQKTIRPSEAVLIREAMADVLEGLPLRRIVMRWNEAGVTTSTGGTWTNGLVLQLLRSPRLAGWRVHRAKGVKWKAVPPIAVDADGNKIRGEWEPILTDEEHRALIARLVRTDTRKTVPKRNARRYQMTGLLRCGKCRGPMYANKVGEGHYYRCSGVQNGTCSNSVSGRGVDDWVGEQVVAHSELVRGIETGKPSEAGARLAELETQIQEAHDLIEDAMGAFRAKRISGAVVFRTVERLEESIARWTAERDTLEAEARAAAPDHVDAERWAAMDTDQKRAACERWLEVVWVLPATYRMNRFDPARLDPVWK